jgi:hypothetical protein
LHGSWRGPPGKTDDAEASEVTSGVDGDLVFSKKATKRHPEYREIEQALQGR